MLYSINRTNAKTSKLALALALAVMVFAAMIPAALAEDTTITVGAIENDTAVNHLYTAYRIFSGTVSEDGKTLSDVQYSTGVNNTLINSLQANTTLNAISEIAALKATATEPATPSTARDVAEALAKVTTTAQSNALADVLNAYFTTTGSYVKHQCGTKETNGSYKINIGDDLGYYFVRDDQTAYKDADNKDTTYTGITKYILQVIGSTSITPKTSAPTIDKVIVENNTEVEANSASVGDTVTYRLKPTVPDISKYKAYTFKMQDNISDGLTLNKATAPASTFTIKVGNTDLVEGTDYTVTYDTTDNDDFTINFTTLYSRFKSTETGDADFATGTAITVEYTATINKDAIIGEDGNDNDARLIYTNDANWGGAGDSNYPTEPTGETPWDKVTTFVTEIDILKIDGDTEMPLKGVTFSISGDALEAVITYSVDFVEKDAAYWTANPTETKYYKLKDNKYTTTPSNVDTVDYYDSEASGKIYAKIETASSTSAKTGTPAKIQVLSGDDGVIKFAGLGIGEYTIKEDATLDGYNLLTGDITVNITGKVGTKELNATTIDDGTEKITWNYAVTGADSSAYTSDANHIVITVENNKGATLPETGGIGTTIFYVAGSLMVLAAAILLITKRRMGAND